MSRTTPRALALASITAIAFAGAVGSAEAKTSKAEKKQNTAIKSAASSAKKAGTAAKKAGTSATAAGKKATTATTSAAQAIADAKKANDGVGVINTTVVPTAVKALGDLQAGLLALKDGLTQVGAGLTAAGAGLSKLASFVGSDEYGIVQIGFTPAGSPAGTTPTVIPGCFYESGNIPDNVQDAIVTGTCLIPNTGATSPASGDVVNILAGIRSNESDGVAASGSTPAVAAGAAGVITYQQKTSALGGGAVTAYAVGATAPNAALGGAPAVSIPLKSPPTSTAPADAGFPFGPIASDKLVDLAASSFTSTPIGTYAPLAANSVRTIDVTIRFNDLTADANDPTA